MPDRLLPPDAVLLHIGPYKTGSTAIQMALHRRRRALRRHDVIYPGSDYRQRRPGWAVLDNTPRGRRPATIDEWQELVAEVTAAKNKRVCISTENFGVAGPQTADRIVSDLGRERVHVIAVARRLDRLLPSQWQERVKTGRETKSYSDWLHAVLDDERQDRSARAFWASHDLTGMLERWTAATGDPSRFTLVVADEADRGLLPRTFEQLLGLPDGMLAPQPGVNSSLSHEKVELLRQVNRAFDEHGWDDHVHMEMVQHGIQTALVHAPATANDTKITAPPAWATERVRELSANRVATIRASEVNVVGDPEKLLVDAAAATDSADSPDVLPVVSATVAIEGAVQGALALMKEAEEQHVRELRRVHRSGNPPARVALDVVSGPELIGEASRRAADAIGKLLSRLK